MERHNILAAILSPLCSWYDKNKRTLPWRETKDPYRVWVSEIMLQQTRVEAALPYYERFLKALPTLKDLAEAEEEKLLKLWEGLGYYSRVKNMQKAAKMIMEQHGGVFPKTANELSLLPGIGDYTAGAISSISFEQPEPAVDGNVLRVLARLFNDETDIMLPKTKKEATEVLKAIYPKAKSKGDFTQALMELGALICVPGTPKCDGCPLNNVCLGRKAGREKELPVRITNKEKKKIKRTVFIYCHQNKIALRKREEKGVLSGMWEFPAAEESLSIEEVLNSHPGALSATFFLTTKHIFTHLVWDMTSYFIEVAEENKDYTWLTPEEIEREIPLPSAMKPFLEELLIRHIR